MARIAIFIKKTLMKSAFPNITEIGCEGPRSKNPLAFKHYNAGEIVEGKTMREHLRFLARVIFSNGRALGSREKAHLWYDGRR